MSNNSQTQYETSSFETSIVSFDKELIGKANSVPLTRLFKKYGIALSEVDRKSKCPFPSHSGGRESSASMFYYPDTNSFFCFGCRRGGQSCHSVEFLSNLKNISKLEAANVILNHWKDEVTFAAIEEFGAAEYLFNFLAFSSLVRDFRARHSDEKSIKFIEHICFVYDEINNKHNLNHKALETLFLALKEKVDQYE